eukprot:TRINITY_DN6339_c0_g1_i2.p1 TRINITY_DN6339_c0_g1~~TRINITY_DN6339_c0_g1_i2.p1  ORF type:complete len:255 (-),score=57.26 TRINITY_DN6339_c0_g1_i2:127-810(-)
MASMGRIGHDAAQAAGAAVAKILPSEDVRGYMDHAILPVLSPVIEELLHHVHESGELQRMLRERAEQESLSRVMRRQQNLSNAPAEAAPTVGRGEHGKSSHYRGGSSVSPPSSAGGNAATSIAAAVEDPVTPEAAESDGAEPPGFDPVMWLSERLAELAAGPASHYREQIEQRIRLKLQEEDASILEEGEEEGCDLSGRGQAPAASTDDGDPSGAPAAKGAIASSDG